MDKKKFLEKISSNKSKKILILSLIFISMFVLNFLTPLIVDDYEYSGENKKISNFLEIIKFQVNHYKTWGGRSVAHTIVQIFLIITGKPLFNVLNSLMYVALIWLIYVISKPADEEKPILLLAIHLLLWFVLPVFGQTCIWLTGACNYLWTTVIILFFIYQYKNNKKEDNLLNIILMFLFGILAGWTNENTAFGLIVIISGIMCIYRKNGIDIRKWNISGLIGAIVGFIILIVAPGNFSRSEKFIDDNSIIVKLIKRTLEYSQMIVEYLLPLIVMVTILITINLYKKKKITKEVLLYLIAAFFTVYSMVLSPTFPARAWFGVIIFIVIAIINLLYNTLNIHRIYTFILANLLIIYTIIFCNEYIEAVYSINDLKQIWDERIVYINEEKEKGNLDIEVEDYFSTNNKHNPQCSLGDIRNDSTYWLNDAVSKYYGINSIKLTK